MSDNSRNSSYPRPAGVTFLVIINALGCIITLLFWLSILFSKLVPSPADLTLFAERVNAATTRGFLIADLVYSVPLLFVATIGLWRMRPWGWTAAQMVNALWLFSMTVIWIRDLYGKISPGGLLFLPFTLIALWAIRYLWQQRYLFWLS
jgi:hypothetical protein